MEFRSGVHERSPSISALQQDLARIDRAIAEQQQRWLQRQRDAEAVFATASGKDQQAAGGADGLCAFIVGGVDAGVCAL